MSDDADIARRRAIVANHNALCDEIPQAIVTSVVASGGEAADIMTVLESITIGIFLTIVKPGCDEEAISRLVEGIRFRLNILRPEGEKLKALAMTPAQGTA